MKDKIQILINELTEKKELTDNEKYCLTHLKCIVARYSMTEDIAKRHAKENIKDKKIVSKKVTKKRIK